MPASTSPAARTVVWADAVTIAVAADRHAELVAAVRSGADVALDATAVTQVDGSALQLLAAARLTAGPRFRLSGVSPAAAEAIHRAGLGALLPAGPTPNPS